MAEFKFEDDLLKHYIRKEVWVPRCKSRRNALKEATTGRAEPRRLKYFTFCAVGALDVLLLDREKIIRQSGAGAFDTVFFFDKDPESVVETQKRIPGAVGFPGNFVDVVLLAQEGDEGTGLEIPSDIADTRINRRDKLMRAQLARFIKAFPFDVINLDVEQFLYPESDELPGRLTNAIRRVFEWQCREGESSGKPVKVSEFELMFTTLGV